MSLGTRIMTNLFVTLTLVADAVAVWVLVAGLLAAGRIRRPFDATAKLLSGWARPLAIAVAATATLGSLYYSEIVGFAPCRLCWYQRFAMYPLAVILAVGFWRPARTITRWLAMAVAGVGAGIAAYHWLVERIPSLAASSSCSVTVPCSVPWFTELGFITIAWMALSGFLAVIALMVCEARAARLGADASARLIGENDRNDEEPSL